MRRLSSRSGTTCVLYSLARPHFLLFFHGRRYNDDISLEDAIHTALLTLKEGFEGQMTEKTIEIGVVTVPTLAELEEGKIGGTTGRVKPTFRKLTEEEVRDYLAL
jgi:20S proteasome subunit alpha 2